jgi:hypothetical protein
MRSEALGTSLRVWGDDKDVGVGESASTYFSQDKYEINGRTIKFGFGRLLTFAVGAFEFLSSLCARSACPINALKRFPCTRGAGSTRYLGGKG